MKNDDYDDLLNLKRKEKKRLAQRQTKISNMLAKKNEKKKQQDE